MALIEFELPDIGEGIAEGEIVKWLIDEGGAVAEDQPIVEVMTDKATVEIPSPAAGVLVKHVVEEGAVVPIDTVIFHIRTEGDAPTASPEAEAEPAAVTEPVPAAEPVAVAAAAPAAPAAAPSGTGVKVLAPPAIRHAAREHGVDLGQIAGSGAGGRITRDDFEAFMASSAPPAVPAAAAPAPRPAAAPVHSGPDSERVPLRGMRRRISDAMTRSVQTAAHFTVMEEVDVTELVRVRKAAKEMGAARGVSVTYMPFIIKAVCAGLRDYPMLNSSMDDAAGEMVIHHRRHIGFATDTPNGLVVPVVFDADAKDMWQIAGELSDLAVRARDGKAKSEELSGSTFTITNAGNLGGTLATPIINWPEAAILGVHAIRRKPAVVEDQIVPRDMMNLSVSIDHRIVDGADGVRFLTVLKNLLEHPGLLSLT